MNIRDRAREYAESRWPRQKYGVHVNPSLIRSEMVGAVDWAAGLDPTDEQISAGARALFLTINAHEAVADAVGLDWSKIPAATRAPWEEAARSVLLAVREAGTA